LNHIRAADRNQHKFNSNNSNVFRVIPPGQTCLCQSSGLALSILPPSLPKPLHLAPVQLVCLGIDTQLRLISGGGIFEENGFFGTVKKIFMRQKLLEAEN